MWLIFGLLFGGSLLFEFELIGKVEFGIYFFFGLRLGFDVVMDIFFFFGKGLGLIFLLLFFGFGREDCGIRDEFMLIVFGKLFWIVVVFDGDGFFLLC